MLPIARARLIDALLNRKGVFIRAYGAAARLPAQQLIKRSVAWRCSSRVARPVLHCAARMRRWRALDAHE